MRNAHRAIAVTLTNECSNCGSLALPHHVCETCGHYKGKKIMLTRADKARTRKESTTS